MTLNSAGNPSDSTPFRTPFVLSKAERHQLDRLIGAAAFNSDVSQRLLTGDRELMREFDIPAHIQDWLVTVPATTLRHIAQAIAYHP